VTTAEKLGLACWWQRLWWL